MSLFFSMIRQPPTSTLFPCTTHFLSLRSTVAAASKPLTPASGMPEGGSTRQRRRVSDVKRLRSRSEEHTSELQSRQYLVSRMLLDQKKYINYCTYYVFYKLSPYVYDV